MGAERGRHRVRRGDAHAIRDMWNPRCVSDPGTRHRRRVLLRDDRRRGRAHELGRAEPRVRAPRRRWHVQRPHDRHDRAGQGRPPVLPGAVALPDADDRLHRPRRRAGGRMRRPGRGAVERAEHFPDAGASLGQIITAGDCTQVSEMIAAVELRHGSGRPVQFPADPPAGRPTVMCGDQPAATVYKEDFEDGLTGWTLTNQGVFAGWRPRAIRLDPGHDRCRAGVRALRPSRWTRRRGTATSQPATSRAFR